MKKESKHPESDATPHLSRRGGELQEFGTVINMPNGLSKDICTKSVANLNRILADTITLRDLYKKHHWQVAGPTFYELHLMYDKHSEGQSELVDAIAERIQLLGGVSVAMAADVAEMSGIERPPSGREAVPLQLSRTLRAHEQILKETHEAATLADDLGDHGTNDLLASKVIPVNEFQLWFVSQHLVNAPVTESNRESSSQAA